MREPKGAELKAEGCKYHLSETVVLVMSIPGKDISPWRNKRFQCWVKESRNWNIPLVAERKKLPKESYVQRTQELACRSSHWPSLGQLISNSE